MITYRRPRLDEALAFAALHVNCWRETYSAFLPAELVSSFAADTRLPMWQSVLPNAERFVLGAFVDDIPAGFVMSGPSDDKHVDDQDGHLWAIYIAKLHHRRGIGRELFSAALQDWNAQGGKTMTIGVLAENLSARRFYEAMGARLVKHGVYNWGGFDLADCIYLSDVSPV